MKAYKFKLYQSKRNRYLIGLIFIAAQIFNHCIALHKRYYRLYGKHLNVYQLQKYITKLKKLDKYQHWNRLGSQAIQDIAQRIDKGYNLFFENLKARKARKTKRFVAPPSFKKSRKYKSFTLKQAGYKFLGGNRIRIGKKVFKIFKSRNTQGNAKTVAIKRDAVGDLWLIVTTDWTDGPETISQRRNSVGFDFGLKTFLTASDGNHIQSPEFFKRGQNAVKRANRKISVKLRGSNNRRKALLNLARVHRKIANQRSDFHWKLANQITDKYDVICFETLNMDSMKRLWGKKISDLAFYSFLQKVFYLAHKKGKVIRFIDRWFPSSKMCHVCGVLNDSLELHQRQWTCDSCDNPHDRDLNAAINIHAVGMSTANGVTVRPTAMVG